VIQRYAELPVVFGLQCNSARWHGPGRTPEEEREPHRVAVFRQDVAPMGRRDGQAEQPRHAPRWHGQGRKDESRILS